MITVGILTSYHVYCITTNTTTIEGWEKGRSLTIKGMGKIQNVMYRKRSNVYNQNLLTCVYKYNRLNAPMIKGSTKIYNLY